MGRPFLKLKPKIVIRLEHDVRITLFKGHPNEEHTGHERRNQFFRISRADGLQIFLGPGIDFESFQPLVGGFWVG